MTFLFTQRGGLFDNKRSDTSLFTQRSIQEKVPLALLSVQSALTRREPFGKLRALAFPPKFSHPTSLKLRGIRSVSVSRLSSLDCTAKRIAKGVLTSLLSTSRHLVARRHMVFGLRSKGDLITWLRSKANLTRR